MKFMARLYNWHRYVQDRLFYIGFTWTLKLRRARLASEAKRAQEKAS